MKEHVIDYFSESLKFLAAFVGGSLPTYIAMREKSKRNRVAEQITNSDYWRTEVKNIMSHTDDKIERVTEEFNEEINKLTEELQRCKEQYLKQ